jgi:membrane protease YdiL (CAAX protease family)
MEDENPTRPGQPDAETAAPPAPEAASADGESPLQPVGHGTATIPRTDGNLAAAEIISTVPSAPIFASLPPEQPKLWRGRDLLIFVLLAVVWLIVSQFGCLAVYAILKPIVGWHLTVYELAQNAIFAVVTQVIYYGPLFLYIYILVAVQYRLPFWEGIRWRWPGGRQAGRIFVSGIVLAIGLVIVEAWLPQNKAFPLEKLFSSPAAAYTLAIFSVTVAPFMEEIIFRGVFFAFFERMVGIRFALVVTALLFALIHAPEYWGAWSGLALILVVGLVCSTARAITGSVVPGFILHVAYNGTLMALLFVGTHHFRHLPALYAL